MRKIITALGACLILAACGNPDAASSNRRAMAAAMLMAGAGGLNGYAASQSAIAARPFYAPPMAQTGCRPNYVGGFICTPY